MSAVNHHWVCAVNHHCMGAVNHHWMCAVNHHFMGAVNHYWVGVVIRIVEWILLIIIIGRVLLII